MAKNSTVFLDEKRKNRFKDKGILSFQELFTGLNKNSGNLRKSTSNKINSRNKKQIGNINKRFERYFISNYPFNIIKFVINI